MRPSSAAPSTTRLTSSAAADGAMFKDDSDFEEVACNDAEERKWGCDAKRCRPEPEAWARKQAAKRARRAPTDDADDADAD